MSGFFLFSMIFCSCYKKVVLHQNFSLQVYITKMGRYISQKFMKIHEIYPWKSLDMNMKLKKFSDVSNSCIKL